MESGYTKSPRLSTIEKLAHVLNSSVEYLTYTEILPLYQSLSEEGKNKVIKYAKKILIKENKNLDTIK